MVLGMGKPRLLDIQTKFNIMHVSWAKRKACLPSMLSPKGSSPVLRDNLRPECWVATGKPPHGT